MSHDSVRILAIDPSTRGFGYVIFELPFRHGYLDRPLVQLDWYSRGSEPLVYALGNRGARVLEGTPKTPGRGLRWDTKNRNLSRVFLQHTLAVAEIMVAFEAACRRRAGLELITPEEILARAREEKRRERLRFRWQVDVRLHGKTIRLGIEPDKVFGLNFESSSKSHQAAFFFLEADRGTMPVTREGLQQTSFLRKLLAYKATWRGRVHRSQLGIRSFRVLVVTTNIERVASLIAACRRLSGGAGLFLFTDRASLSGVDILNHEWVNGRGERVALGSDAPLRAG